MFKILLITRQQIKIIMTRTCLLSRTISIKTSSLTHNVFRAIRMRIRLYNNLKYRILMRKRFGQIIGSKRITTPRTTSFCTLAGGLLNSQGNTYTTSIRTRCHRNAGDLDTRTRNSMNYHIRNQRSSILSTTRLNTNNLGLTRLIGLNHLSMNSSTSEFRDRGSFGGDEFHRI